LEVNGTAKIDTGLIAPLLYPSSDSTTAIQIDKANGTSNVVDIDTTNPRVGIGTTAPATTLDVNGTVTVENGNINTAGTLSLQSYGVTSLTVRNNGSVVAAGSFEIDSNFPGAN
jgi:hypothetical protein